MASMKRKKARAVKSGAEVTDAELGVLELLWRSGALSIGQIASTLYGGVSASSRATVQKLLFRLIEKGVVKRREDTRPIQYEAAEERGDLLARMLQRTAQKLCGGSMTFLLTQLVGATPEFSDKDRRALLDLIDGLSSTKGRGSSSRKK